MSDAAAEPATAASGHDERPATFREVMASREYKAVFSASALSWFGDYAARAAVTAIVFQQTGSVAASAATFAISYLPWLGFGSLLSAVAERYPYRRVMVLCDVVRLLIMTVIAFLHLPLLVLMVLLFLTALLNPPFDAARSALLPQILSGDRYVLGLSLQRIIGQVAMVAGYVGGAAFTAYNSRVALIFNAATFGFSACAIGLGVHERKPAQRVEERSNLLRETAEGYSIVFRAPVLRAVALVVFGGACFGAIPEGLAAAWATEFPGADRYRGWFQAAIMMASAVGLIAGSLAVSRFVQPSKRNSLIRPFAVLTPLTLVPAVLQPGIVVVVAMAVACGVAMSGMLPATNGLFVQALPPSYRARAFGVIQSGLFLIQGAAVTITGWLATHYPLAEVVGWWALGGVVVMLAISLTWPSRATISEAIATNKLRIAAADHTEKTGTGQDFGEDTIDLGRPNSPLRRFRPPSALPGPLDPELAGQATLDLTSRRVAFGAPETAAHDGRGFAVARPASSETGPAASLDGGSAASVDGGPAASLDDDPAASLDADPAVFPEAEPTVDLTSRRASFSKETTVDLTTKSAGGKHRNPSPNAGQY